MSADSISTANYAVVIADLRAKRDDMDRTIAMLEAMAGVLSKTPAQTPPPKPPVTEKPREMQSVGIGQACLDALKEAGKP